MEGERGRQNLFLAATCVAAIITPMLSNMLNLALVQIGEHFDVSAHYLGYINTAYLLGSVVGMVPAARMADIWGLRRMFRTGLLLSAVISLLMFVQPTFESLLIMRFFSGLVLSFVLVTSLTLISHMVAPESRGWAIGVNTGAVYTGLALGPFIGGVITDGIGWTYIFMLISILSLAALGMSVFVDREIVPRQGASMDWAGAAGWAVSMFVLMMGIMNSTKPYALVMIPAGAVLLVLEVLYLRRRDNPIFKVALFRNRGYAASSIATFMNYSAWYSVSFFLPLYLETVGSMSATDAGMIMLIQPVVQIIMANIAGRLYDRLKDKRLLQAAGALATAVGVAMFLFLGTESDATYAAAILVVGGIGLGLFSTPNTALMMSLVEPQDRGDASSTVSLMRQTGMMLSMGVAMGCISLIMGSTENIKPENYGLFVDTIHLAFGICLVACIIGFAATLRARRMGI